MRATVVVMFVTAGSLFSKIGAVQLIAEQQLTLRIHDYARVDPGSSCGPSVSSPILTVR
jgi:hypothetical protein